MRQGHQNRRGRNRNHNNGGSRKGQNPVTRSYESNGPEMKIRGTPAHIAEKYIALSRDAQTNGDPVLAENFLQHAEHYNRIILAYRDAQAQQASEQSGAQPTSGNGQHRQQSGQDPSVGDGGDVDPADAAQPDTNGQPPARRQSRAREDRSPEGRGEGRQPRQRQPRARKPRAPSADTEGGEDAPRRSADQGGAVPEHEQPEFLRRSIRRPRRSAEKSEGSAVTADDSAQD